MFFVRTAGEADLDAVRALLVDTWHATYDGIYGAERVNEITDDWHSIASLRRCLTRPNSEFLVADDGEHIGGMAFITATLYTGCRMVLFEHFDPQRTPFAMAERSPTLLGSAVPFFHAYIEAQRQHGRRGACGKSSAWALHPYLRLSSLLAVALSSNGRTAPDVTLRLTNCCCAHRGTRRGQAREAPPSEHPQPPARARNRPR